MNCVRVTENFCFFFFFFSARPVGAAEGGRGM